MATGYHHQVDMSQVEVFINQLYNAAESNNVMSILMVMRRMDRMINEWTSDKADLVCQLADLGYCSLVSDLLIRAHRTDLTKENKELIIQIYTSLNQFAHLSGKFAKSLAGNQEFQEILRTNLISDSKEASRSGDHEFVMFMNTISVSILFSMVSRNVDYFSEPTTKKALVKILHLESIRDTDAVLCLLTLGLMMNERDEELLENISKHVLGVYIDCLRDACKEESRTYENYTVRQLLQGIILLCVADDHIKEKFIYGGIPELFKCIVRCNRSDELVMALKVMRTLASCQSAVSGRLVSEYKIDTSLAPLLAHPVADVKKLAAELQTDLDGIHRVKRAELAVDVTGASASSESFAIPQSATLGAEAAVAEFSPRGMPSLFSTAQPTYMSMDVPRGAWQSWSKKQLQDHLLEADLSRSSVQKLSWLDGRLLLELVRFKRCSPPTFCSMVDKIRDTSGMDMVDGLKFSAFISEIDKFN